MGVPTAIQKASSLVLAMWWNASYPVRLGWTTDVDGAELRLLFCAHSRMCVVAPERLALTAGNLLDCMRRPCPAKAIPLPIDREGPVLTHLVRRASEFTTMSQPSLRSGEASYHCSTRRSSQARP